MTADQKERLIEIVLDDFDFVKAHRYMQSVGWHYADDPENTPSVGRLYRTAKDLLTLAANRNATVSSGGFIAVCIGDSIELSFSIAQTSADIGDLKYR